MAYRDKPNPRNGTGKRNVEGLWPSSGLFKRMRHDMEAKKTSQAQQIQGNRISSRSAGRRGRFRAIRTVTEIGPGTVRLPLSCPAAAHFPAPHVALPVT